jgi:hypothetical protein
LADIESHSPHPLLLSSSWALFTFFCLLIYDPAMLLSSLPRSLLFYRSRALPYISYPSPPPTQTSMLFLQAPLPSVFPSIFSILLVEISHDKLQRIQNPKRQCLECISSGGKFFVFNSFFGLRIRKILNSVTSLDYCTVLYSSLKSKKKLKRKFGLLALLFSYILLDIIRDLSQWRRTDSESETATPRLWLPSLPPLCGVAPPPSQPRMYGPGVGTEYSYKREIISLFARRGERFAVLFPCRPYSTALRQAVAVQYPGRHARKRKHHREPTYRVRKE